MYSENRLQKICSVYEDISRFRKECYGLYVGYVYYMRLYDLVFASCFKGTSLGTLDDVFYYASQHSGFIKNGYRLPLDMDDCFSSLRDGNENWAFFRYFKSSPFWCYETTSMFEPRLEEECETICESVSEMRNFLCGHIPCICHEEALFDRPVVEELMTLFSGDNEVDGTVFVIGSVLLKHFILAKQRGIFQDDELVQVIEEYLSDMAGSFSSVFDTVVRTDISDLNKLDCYYLFISCDWVAASMYYYPGLIAEINPLLMFSGYIIDSLIFKLDEKYNFLPQDVVRYKEVL